MTQISPVSASAALGPAVSPMSADEHPKGFPSTVAPRLSIYLGLGVIWAIRGTSTVCPR
jgi:hypothetical protein